MHTKHLAPIVFVALLALAPASASAASELSAPHAQAIGTAIAAGHLAVLLQEKTQPTHAAGEPAFTLHAEHVRLETDHSDAAVGAGVNLKANPATTVEEHEDVIVQGLAHRDNYRFSVWPLSRSSVTVNDGACIEAAPSSSGSLERLPLVAARDSNDADTAAAVALEGCTPGTNVTIKGDFLVRLWEWDARLSSVEESVLLSSGKRNLDGSAPGGEADPSVVAGQATEQFLFASNATLTIPQLAGNHQLFVRGADVASSGGFVLHGATGTVAGASVERQSVFVQGQDLRLSLQGTGVGAPLSTALTGSITHMELDGVPVAGAFAAPAAAAPWLWAWGLGSMAIAATVAGGIYTRHRHEDFGQDVDVLVAGARTCARYDRHARATRLVHRALRLDPDDPEANVLRAMCLTNAGRYLVAEDAYKAAHDHLKHSHVQGAAYWFSINAYQAARNAMELRGEAQRAGERQEWQGVAMQWLTIAFEANEELVPEAQREPDFAPILDAVWVMCNHARAP